ncbi:MAG TPA: hypothetical protein VHM70_05920 [Polyangiaceae bacterium]|nr:hypothetical protein [Polyangiaceae bacterium]
MTKDRKLRLTKTRPYPAAKSALCALLGLGAMFASSSAAARPGTHPDPVSTFDTRGSSAVLAYRNGVGFSGTSRVFSYNANFSSTSGNFSAQFGAHYLQLKLHPEDLMLHGAAASGIALFSWPLSRRRSNGVPKVALDFFFGAVPTAAVSGPENFLTVPVDLGFGLSMAPAPWITFTPWFEAAPSANLDTTVSELDFSSAVANRFNAANFDPRTNPVPQLTQDDVAKVLQKSVDLRFSFHVAMRGGLTMTMHLGETWDLNGYATATTLGSAFGGPFLAQAGGGLTYHWDDIVPAVLPPSRRLQHESCDDIERRFMMCPNYRPPTNSSSTRGGPGSLTPVPSSSPAPTAPAPTAPPMLPAPPVQTSPQPPAPAETAPSSGVPTLPPPPPPAAPVTPESEAPGASPQTPSASF